METDFAVSELSCMLIVAFWKSLKICISVDGLIAIKEPLGRYEEPVVWAWSHTAIHLSLHSSNKCHLYTEATHISLLADIIDACFSGYVYWLNATANVLRVGSNNKSWWWLSDIWTPQEPWKYGGVISIGLIEQCIRLITGQYSKKVLVLWICSCKHAINSTLPWKQPFPVSFLTKRAGGMEESKARGLTQHLADCCELLSQFSSCLNLVQAGAP